MPLTGFPYMKACPLTGNLAEDAVRLLADNGRPGTAAHVERVAGACAELAGRFRLDREKCRAAGLLHDVSAVIRPADMLLFAEEQRWPLCGAERRYPFLLHQRLSALLAREHFGVKDGEILSAIACHTTLRPFAGALDMALFLADKIAWDQAGEPPYLSALSSALDRSLPCACLRFMTWSEENGRVLCPHDDWTAALAWLRETGASGGTDP